jgi:hypothetical protein
LKELALLLDHGANIHEQDYHGMDACMAAASAGQEPALRLLLSRGANLHATNAKGQSALALAAGQGAISCVKTLLDAGASVHAVDLDGSTALIKAAPFVDCLEELLNAGSNLEARDRKNASCAMHAARLARPDSLAFLTSRGAHLRARDMLDPCAVHQAAAHGAGSCLTFALAQGLPPDRRRGFRRSTPAMVATVAGHLHCLKLLARAGADLEAQDARGWRLIHCAAAHGRLDALEFLLGKGVDPRPLDQSGLSPWDVADSHPQSRAFLAAHAHRQELGDVTSSAPSLSSAVLARPRQARI